jgi:peptide/nickel transport system permease protein
MVDVRRFLLYAGRRALGAFVVLLGVALITFFISHLLSPDPSRLWAGPKARQSTIDAVRMRYHLGEPAHVQFFYFLVDMLTGNFGIDPLTGQSVLREILFYLPNTIELVLAAMLVIVVLGVGLGYIAGMNFGRLTDSVVRVVYLVTWSTPMFLGSIGAVLFFSTYTHLFPSGGMFSLTLTPPPTITGIFILDSLLALDFSAFASGLYYLALPALTLALLNFGLVTRISRSSILNVRWATHVKAARAKGLPEKEVHRRHVLRNALIDTNTIVAIMFGWLLSGTVVVEDIFAWPGIGQFAYQAITSVDYPALIPIVLVFTLGVIIANFLADIVYSILDPRIVLGGMA